MQSAAQISDNYVCAGLSIEKIERGVPMTYSAQHRAILDSMAGTAKEEVPLLTGQNSRLFSLFVQRQKIDCRKVKNLEFVTEYNIFIFESLSHGMNVYHDIFPRHEPLISFISFLT